jgi:hypothetical protein
VKFLWALHAATSDRLTGSTATLVGKVSGRYGKGVGVRRLHPGIALMLKVESGEAKRNGTPVCWCCRSPIARPIMQASPSRFRRRSNSAFLALVSSRAATQVRRT